MRDRCPHVVSVNRVMTMPVHFHIRQRRPGGGTRVRRLMITMQRIYLLLSPRYRGGPTPVSDRSPPSPPTHYFSCSPLQILPGPSYSAHQSPEYTHVSSREMAGVMDAICTLAATQAAQHAAQEQRLTQCYTMLQQIMTHLGLPHDPAQREEPATDAGFIGCPWQQLQQLHTHHHHSSEVVRSLFGLCYSFSFINCLLILIRIFFFCISHSRQ